jgi:hypothetical protein
MSRTYLSNITRFALLLLIAGMMVSCDSFTDFGDLNEDPTTAQEVEPGMQLTTIQLATAGTRYEMWRAQLLYGENVSQHLVNAFYGGGNNYTENVDWLTAFWNTAYSGTGIPERAQVKNIEALINQLETQKEEGEQVDNYLAAARIMRVFIYHRITDLYGDIPYTEAGKGAINREFTPVYDPQSEIYTNFFTELDEAVNQFDPSQPTYGDNDLFYSGDITQWQKFGNSLRLRLALRLEKADLGKAETQALAAINGPSGVMSSNDDIAMVKHQSGPSAGPAGMNTNPISEAMNDGGDREYVAQTLVDWMDNRDDPRLGIYAESNKPFLGFPSGYTGSSISGHPSYTGDVADYSRVNEMLIDLEDPTFFQTYAEVEFMLAEVAARGWTADAAASHYENGVRAAMNYLSLYDASGGANISSSAINTYLTNNPYNATAGLEQQLEQINSQYWAAVFLNGIEAWSNWRRSGYPALEPPQPNNASFPAGNQTNGEIPRRLMYPEGTESVLNAENYDEVISRQGENNMTTRVWWDQQ